MGFFNVNFEYFLELKDMFNKSKGPIMPILKRIISEKTIMVGCQRMRQRSDLR